MTNLTDLKRTLNLVCAKNRTDPRLPDFFLMSDDERLPDPLNTAQQMPSGSAIILRHRDPAQHRRLAFSLRPVCRARKVGLLIAEDPALARACGADGVHFSEQSVRRNRPATCAKIDHNWIVSAAAHSRQSALRAQQAQVDAILLSPVFPTPSHPAGKTLGVLAFCAIARSINTAVFALGGMDTQSIKRLQHCRLSGIAGIDYLVKILNKNAMPQAGICLPPKLV